MGEVINLNEHEAANKMRELAKDEICLFYSYQDMYHAVTRPMNTQEIDDDGIFWFLSHKNSNKNQHISRNNKVQLLYSNPAKQKYLSVDGEAIILYDQNKINQLWNSFAKAWFTERKTDPNLSLIKVKPIEAYYWDTKYGKMVSFFKIMLSAVTGKTMDDGVEGKLVL